MKRHWEPSGVPEKSGEKHMRVPHESVLTANSGDQVHPKVKGKQLGREGKPEQATKWTGKAH